MAMQLQDFIIGMLLFSLAVFGFTLFMGELSTNYERPLDTEFNATYTKINSTLNLAKDLEDKIGTEGETSSSNPTTSAFQNSLEAIRSMSTGFTMLKDTTNAFSNDLGINPTFARVLIAAFGILLTFLIIAFIRGAVVLNA